MSSNDESLNLHFAAAFVRGSVKHDGTIKLSQALLDTPLEQLNENELTEIVGVGKQAGLKLYRFKKSLGQLARVKRVIGMLHNIAAQSLLDIGSGRGAFLWPFMHAFPHVPVTAMDIDEHRVQLYETVRLGGIERLTSLHADIRTNKLPEKSFDVVTCLEVLEHLDKPQAALQNIVQAARRHLVLSVPAREDDNPHHLHLLTEGFLSEMLHDVGCTRFRFEYTLGHLIAFVTVPMP